MRNIKFDPEAFGEYADWLESNPKIVGRINQLIVNAARDPFKGIGKPEPLKGNYQGCWSRLITQEHRLIYKADAETIFILKCRGHYD